MTIILTLLARWGVPERLRKPLLIALAIAAALALWGLWMRSHDRGVIDRHEAVIKAEVAGKVLDAERTANTNDAARAETRAADSAATKGAIRDAEQAHPEQARAAAGPASRAAADSLRNRSAKARPAAD